MIRGPAKCEFATSTFQLDPLAATKIMQCVENGGTVMTRLILALVLPVLLRVAHPHIDFAVDGSHVRCSR